MRYSRYLLPILREAPREAEIVSHRLMLRAGMVRQQAAGIYSWLPLGLKVLRRVEAIVREEQNRAGAVEIVPVAPRAGAAATRLLLRARKGGGTPLRLWPPLELHAGSAQGYTEPYSVAATAVLRGMVAIVPPERTRADCAARQAKRACPAPSLPPGDTISGALRPHTLGGRPDT